MGTVGSSSSGMKMVMMLTTRRSSTSSRRMMSSTSSRRMMSSTSSRRMKGHMDERVEDPLGADMLVGAHRRIRGLGKTLEERIRSVMSNTWGPKLLEPLVGWVLSIGTRLCFTCGRRSFVCYTYTCFACDSWYVL